MKRLELDDLTSMRVMIESPLDLRTLKVYNEIVNQLASVDHPLQVFINEFKRQFSKTYTDYIEENKAKIECESKKFKFGIDVRISA